MKPAILGGPKAVTLKQEDAMKWPLIGTEEEQAVLEVLRDGDLSCHPVTRELERDYCETFGRRFALAHCNGTAALMAAFFAMDLQPGDEVIVPSATFWASVVPMLWFDAIPVFCESEPDRMGLDPEDVARKITARTRAIVVVHLWGFPSRMTELLEIARKNNLRVIEDASHAHGATWRGRQCGTLGDVSVFSLQTSKLAPAGEGGMFLTDDAQLYEKAVCLGDMVRILELNSPARRFAGTTFGIKTRMAPMSAAIARVQLRKLEAHNTIRNKNAQFLSLEFSKLGLDPFLPPAHIKRVYYEFLVRYDAKRTGLSRELFVEALRAEGCDASLPRYPLLHQQPLFTEEGQAGRLRPIMQAGRPRSIMQAGRLRSIMQAGRLRSIMQAGRLRSLPATEAANEKLIRFPVFTQSCEELLKQYVEAVEKVIEHAEEVFRVNPFCLVE